MSHADFWLERLPELPGWSGTLEASCGGASRKNGAVWMGDGPHISSCRAPSGNQPDQSHRICIFSRWNFQLPGKTLTIASRSSVIKNGLLIMQSTPPSRLPEDFNISA
jgi:hypothetical protein